MAHTESIAESPARTPDYSAEPAPVDADFEARWAAWQARGAAHDRTVRRKLVMLAPVLAIAAAIMDGLLRR